MTGMTSNKPYLIRAIYEWIVDNHLTPYVVVNALYPDIQIPQAFVKEGKIVLNVSPQACRGMHLNNDRIIFTAKFSGKVEQIAFPPSAVLAIYAKENGRGMEFPEELSESLAAGEAIPASASAPNRKKPFLSLVKNPKDE